MVVGIVRPSEYRRRMRRVREVWLGLWLSAGLVAFCGVARAEQLLEFRLPSGPHAPADAPDVIVHVPTRLDRRAPIHWLVLLHGFSSCARALMADGETPCQRGGPPKRGYGLAQLHEQAHSNTLLIVPQLAYLARNARAPRFETEGGFARFVAELRKLLRSALDGEPAPASLSLLAHSAGYRAAAAILRDTGGANDVGTVVLCDALYAHWDVFARWLEASGSHRLISLHTRDPDTTEGNRKLRALVGNTRQLTIERVDTPHGLVPERHLLELLERLFGST